MSTANGMERGPTPISPIGTNGGTYMSYDASPIRVQCDVVAPARNLAKPRGDELYQPKRFDTHRAGTTCRSVGRITIDRAIVEPARLGTAGVPRGAPENHIGSR
jgi:hypothetical protein